MPDWVPRYDVRPSPLRLAVGMLALISSILFALIAVRGALETASAALHAMEFGWATFFPAISNGTMQFGMRSFFERLSYLMIAAPIWLTILVVLLRFQSSFRIDEVGIHNPLWPVVLARRSRTGTIRWNEDVALVTAVPWLLASLRATPNDPRSIQRRWPPTTIVLPASWLLPDKSERADRIRHYAPPEHPVRQYYAVYDVIVEKSPQPESNSHGDPIE